MPSEDGKRPPGLFEGGKESCQKASSVFMPNERSDRFIGGNGNRARSSKKKGPLPNPKIGRVELEFIFPRRYGTKKKASSSPGGERGKKRAPSSPLFNDRSKRKNSRGCEVLNREKKWFQWGS